MAQILTWLDSGKKFGIPLEECKEVNRDVILTEVPHSSKFISGIVNLRGDTVTVINLGILLGYTQDDKKDHNVTIRLKTISNNLAIRADDVDDILDLNESAFESAASQLGEMEAKYIKKVAMSKGGLILVLNTTSMQNLNV
jgi:purine-binding chemotaxis protein CheW